MMDLGRIYLGHRPAAAIEKLYLSISIRQFAVSMIAIFEPIYLYKLYGSIRAVLFFYVVVYGIYFFMVPLGGKITARWGAERSMSCSIFFVILYYLALYAAKDHPYAIYVAGISFIADKVFLRVAYHSDMAQNGARKYRGREVGAMSLLETIAGTIGPLVGGFVLLYAGFGGLFVLVSLIGLIAILPMSGQCRSAREGNLSVRESFRNFFRPEDNFHRKDSLAYMGYGEEIVSAALWPVFVFTLLPDYHIIGSVATGALVLVTVSRLFMGKVADSLDRAGKCRWVSLVATLYALVQGVRRSVGGAWGVFSVNFISDTLKSGITYPYFTYVYSAGGKNSGFLEYAVFYEMSLVFGRVLLGAFLLISSYYFAGLDFWFIIFLSASLWSFLYTLIRFK